MTYLFYVKLFMKNTIFTELFSYSAKRELFFFYHLTLYNACFLLNVCLQSVECRFLRSLWPGLKMCVFCIELDYTEIYICVDINQRYDRLNNIQA